MTIELAPSILSANFARLADDAKAALEGGGTVLHLEACVHLHRTLQLIESHGCQPAVVINPATPVHTLDEVLDMVHHVLVMSVNPGFGAQTFIHGSLNKIKTLAEVRESLGLSFRIEVDGGVALDTVSDIVHAGAELLVAGNAVFGRGDIRENAKRLLGAPRQSCQAIRSCLMAYLGAARAAVMPCCGGFG